MKAEELMIGNYVFCNAENYENALGRVISIMDGSIGVKLHYEYGNVYCGEEEVSPVKITIGTLEKLGFYDDAEWIINQDGGLTWFFDNTIEFVPRYIHQLQNIMIALNNIEYVV